MMMETQRPEKIIFKQDYSTAILKSVQYYLEKIIITPNKNDLIQGEYLRILIEPRLHPNNHTMKLYLSCHVNLPMNIDWHTIAVSLSKTEKPTGSQFIVFFHNNGYLAIPEIPVHNYRVFMHRVIGKPEYYKSKDMSAAVFFDNTIIIWQESSGRIIKKISTTRPSRYYFSPDGLTIITEYKNGIKKEWVIDKTKTISFFINLPLAATAEDGYPKRIYSVKRQNKYFLNIYKESKNKDHYIFSLNADKPLGTGEFIIKDKDGNNIASYSFRNVQTKYKEFEYEGSLEKIEKITFTIKEK